MTPSPRYLSRVPSCSKTARATRLWNSRSIAKTAFAGCPSLIPVNPTMSANRIPNLLALGFAQSGVTLGKGLHHVG